MDVSRQYQEGRFRENTVGAEFGEYCRIIEFRLENARYGCNQGSPLVKAFVADSDQERLLSRFAHT